MATWARALSTADEGSGNGLDADTVDGSHASAFALLTGASFTGAVNAGTGGAYPQHTFHGQTNFYPDADSGLEINNQGGNATGVVAKTGDGLYLGANGAAGGIAINLSQECSFGQDATFGGKVDIDTTQAISTVLELQANAYSNHIISFHHNAYSGLMGGSIGMVGPITDYGDSTYWTHMSQLGPTDHDYSGVVVNHFGYLGGDSKFRDFVVSDGKKGTVAYFDGSSKAVTFGGNVEINGTGLLTIDSSTSVNLYLDRSASTKHSSAVFQTAGSTNWAMGLTDSDVSGVDGSEFYIGQTANGTSNAFKIDTSNNATFSGAVGVDGLLTASDGLAVSSSGAQLSIGHAGSSDWDTAMDHVEVGHSMALYCETADGADRNAFIGNNVYYNSGHKRRYNDQTCQMLFRAGYISFRTDGAATEDVAFTPTERMKIAEDGAITMTSTLGVTGAITGGGYSGGAISGTTGTFSGEISSDHHAITTTATEKGLSIINTNLSSALRQIDIFIDSNGKGCIRKTSASGLDNDLYIQPDHGNVLFKGSGKVGIGTTSPTSPLHVKSGGTDTAGILLEAASGGELLFRAYESSAGHGQIYMQPNGGGSTVKIDTAGNSYFTGGNVGIGTTAPSKLLHIEGASDPTIYVKDTTNNCIAQVIASDSYGWFGTQSSHKTYLGAAGYYAITIDATTRNVGIGTTSPQKTLSIKDGDMQLFDSANDANIFIGQGNTISSPIYEFSVKTTAGGKFQIKDEANSGDRFTIDADGDVGIGTTSPSYKLDVVGDYSNPSATAAGTAVMGISSAASGSELAIGGVQTGGKIWLQNRHKSVNGYTYELAINPQGGAVTFGSGGATFAGDIDVTGDVTGDRFYLSGAGDWKGSADERYAPLTRDEAVTGSISTTTWWKDGFYWLVPYDCKLDYVLLASEVDAGDTKITIDIHGISTAAEVTVDVALADVAYEFDFNYNLSKGNFLYMQIDPENVAQQFGYTLVFRTR